MGVRCIRGIVAISTIAAVTKRAVQQITLDISRLVPFGLPRYQPQSVLISSSALSGLPAWKWPSTSMLDINGDTFLGALGKWGRLGSSYSPGSPKRVLRNYSLEGQPKTRLPCYLHLVGIVIYLTGYL